MPKTRKPQSAEKIAHGLKKLVNNRHAEFVVDTPTERQLAARMAQFWRLGGYINFSIISWATDDNRFKIKRKD